jgi:hypothetical protein
VNVNRGAPTPAISFDAPPSSIERRFSAQVVDVDDALLERLRSTGASVITDAAETAETGRDWWPLAMAWALDGTVPGVYATGRVCLSPPPLAAAVCVGRLYRCTAASCSI